MSIRLPFQPMAAKRCRAAMTDTLKLWDLASGKLIRTFKGHSSVRQFGCLFTGWPQSAVGQL